MLSNKRVVVYTLILVVLSYIMNYFMRESMYQ
jgi:hypothetical protein